MSNQNLARLALVSWYLFFRNSDIPYMERMNDICASEGDERRIALKELILGKLVVTKGIMDEMNETYGFKGFCMHSLLRHRALDWGDLPEEDKLMNNQALEDDSRVLSAYDIPKFFRLAYVDKIWIITEADRSATTILFPYEY